MIGFRLLAIVLGILCLAAAGAAVLHSHPALSGLTGFFVEKFIPAGPLRAFIRSAEPGDVLVKDYLKYILAGGAVGALGVGILFFISAANPIRMRPFIMVVIIAAVACIALALWKGITLEISYIWWLGDSLAALILVVLLAALYPRRKLKADLSPEIREEVLEE